MVEVSKLRSLDIYTNTGHYVGRVEDVVLNIRLGTISKLQVRAVEPERKQIGLLDNIKGAFHTFKEILGNSLDEARGGYGKEIEVVYYKDGTEFNVSSYVYNGKTYYYGDLTGSSSGHSWSIPCNDCTSQSSLNNLINSFKNYFISDDFDDLIFEPNFEATYTDSLFQINNFQASIEDGNLVMKWEPFTMLPYRAMENIYISYQFKQRPEGTAASANNRRNYLQYDGYSKISDYGLTIPLSELNISEGYMLSSVNAVPYLYIDDDLKNATSKGNSSFVYFDSDGVSSSPIIIEPDIEVDITEEDREQNLYYSIKNFFSGFFRNLNNSLKSAVVPSGDDVMTLLQDMNDWFSERFGFIWYPFDLAIDIVGAFALGEPDSKITVPALTLNMFGGIKLWDEFQADLDPIGFLEYVRFFTSAIMCCGVAGLALNKWNEWIGGEH